MAIEVTVPRLGWSMDEGTLTEWLKRDGDTVRKGDMLFVLEGDKATQEVESFDEGILKLLPRGPQPGDAVQVGQLLAYLVAEGEPAPFESGSAGAEFAANDVPAEARLPAPLPANRSAPSAEFPPLPQGPRASPRARRRAAELGVDWTKVVRTGTGKSGRIRERDVLAALGRAEQTASQPTVSTAASRNVQPHSPIRRTIAERMVASHQTTAPVTLTTTADVTNLVRLRQQLKGSGATVDVVVPSLTDFIVKLTAITLKSFPLLNARWEEHGIVTSAEIHIGIAVDTDAGLLVPVVRNVEQLSLRSLAARSQELIAKARTRRLTAEDMQGGTFTVTNLGSYGIDAFTPILQVPQCAILGIGRIQKAPVFVENQFVPRDMITLSLTFDHRIVDGGPAARFLQAVARAIENPADLLSI